MKEYVPGTTGPVFVDRGPRRESTLDKIKSATPWRENLAPEVGKVTVRQADDSGYIAEPYTEKEVKLIVQQGRERPRDLGGLHDRALDNDIRSREDLRAAESWAEAEATLAGTGQRLRHDGDEASGDPQAYEAGGGFGSRPNYR